MLGGVAAERAAGRGTAPPGRDSTAPTGDNISPDTGLLAAMAQGRPETPLDRQGPRRGLLLGRPGRRPHLHQRQQGRARPTITALDLDGKILWQRPNGEAWSGGHPGTRSTPTIDGDRVYDESPLGEVACLDAKDGKPIWHVNILEKFAAKNIKWAPGRVALDRRPARDLLSRRAADRRGRPGQEDRRGGLEIARRRATRPPTPRPW